MGRAGMMRVCLAGALVFCASVSEAAMEGRMKPFVHRAVEIPAQSFPGDYPADVRVSLFDMGSTTSRALAGYERVTPEDLYTPEKGHGFLEAPDGAEELTDESRNKPRRPAPMMAEVPLKQGIYGIDDLTLDCVIGKKIRFRADVRPGTYDVVVVLGRMTPVYHVYAKVNGTTALEDQDIFTYHLQFRGSREDTTYGGWHKVWTTAEAPDGKIQIEIYGDEAAGERSAEVPRYSAHAERLEGTTKIPLAGPYEMAGLMGVIIVPHTESPVAFDGDKLKAGPDCPKGIAEAVASFNAGEMDQTKAALGSMRDPSLQLARGTIYMALAGTPLLDEDWEMLQAAQGAFKSAIEADTSNYSARVLLSQCDQFFASINHYLNRKNTIGGETAATGRFHQVYMLQRQFPRSHPFHMKHKLYTGRMFKSLVPFLDVPKSVEGIEAFKEVEKRYPDNKYVRLYLHEEWSDKDWPRNRYESPDRTPAWADALRRSFNQCIDFGDWWHDNGQAEDGSIGGGWGDDVEVMPLWGMLSLIDPSGMPKCMDMLDKFTNGLWNGPFIDRDRAFEPQFADAEHAAEPSGDGINYLVGVKYGNPLWVERNMAHAKLVKNVHTGINEKGMRMYRSGDYSASRYGVNQDPGKQQMQNEDAICLRGFRSIPWLVWFNNNPSARKVLLEKADACVSIAMSEESGKPRGIIPASTMWDGTPGGHVTGAGKADGDTGGHKGPWWDGGYGPWPDYPQHYNNLLLSAYLATGDEKYVEPILEQFRFVEERGKKSGYAPIAPEPEKGSVEWAYNQLLRGDSGLATALLQIRLLNDDRRFDEFLAKNAKGWPKYRLSLDKDELARHVEKNLNEPVNKRWPHQTTEACQTDRIAYYPEMVSFYLGGDAHSIFEGLPLMAVTYVDAGRDFAAVVENSSLKDLKLYLHTFYEQERKIGLRLWLLEPGAEYELEYGVDSDNDDEIDEPLGTETFRLEQRGAMKHVKVPGRKTLIVEVRQTKAPDGEGGKALPDLAICEEDVRREAVESWRTTDSSEIDVRVHNIGIVDAKNVEAHVFVQKRGGEPELVERSVLSCVEGADRLDPQITRFGAWGHRGKLASGDKVIVKIDPENKIAEFNEENNVVEKVMSIEEGEK